MKTLIRGGICVTPQGVTEEDLLLDGEKIVALGDFSNSKDRYDRVIDAAGMLVLPGLIDAHTHMELQQSPEFRSVDDFYSGTVAAAMGGTTTIIDHIGFGPAGCDLGYSIEEYQEKAKKSVIDYSFHGVIQHVDAKILEELRGWVQKGIPSFKAYSTYGFKIDDRGMYQLLQTLREEGGLLCVHAENDEMTNYLRERFLEENRTDAIYHALSRPNETEAESVDTMVNLASMAEDAPLYIVHTSTGEGMERIEFARESGQENLYCETCPQYLLLDEAAYFEKGNEEGLKYIMAPPLRSVEDREALWRGVEEGIVDVIATDHCPFLLKDKHKGLEDFTKAPGGAAGVEERPRLIFSEGVMKGRISLGRYVDLMSANPAKIFGLYPRKGALAVGSDADILLLDPMIKETLTVDGLHSSCDYCAYEGMEVTGGIHMVFSRGKLIVEDGVFMGSRGDGQFLPRSAIK